MTTCTMKVVNALVLLTMVLLANAKEHGIRGERKIQTELLARVKVGENGAGGTVDFLSTDNTLVVVTEVYSMYADEVNRAFDSVEDEDVIGFYKTVSDGDDVPNELAKVAVLMAEGKKSREKMMKGAGVLEQPPDFDGSLDIRDGHGVAVHDNDHYHRDDNDRDGDGEGRRRRLDFCSGVSSSSCFCEMYLKGNHIGKKNNSYIYSHLSPYRGYVTHALYKWDGYTWVHRVSRSVAPGTHSRIARYNINGSNSWWRARTQYAGSGDIYHWTVC